MDESVISQALLTSSIISRESDEEDEEEVIAYRQKHRKRTILNDSEEESSSENGLIQNSCDILPNNDLGDVGEREKPVICTSDHAVGPDPDHSTNHHEPSPSHIPAGVRPFELSAVNDDVFDAEQESDTDVAADAAKSGEEDGEESADGTMSAALKRRLAKGASKKAMSGRAGGHPKRDDLNEIHRETQRIVRESSLRLPYHKPPKLDLSVFLSRTEQKRQFLASISTTTPRLKPLLKDVEALNSIISTTQTPCSKTAVVPSTDESGSLQKDISSQLNDLPSAETDNSNTRTVEGMGETPGLSLETVSTDQLFLDEDDLPDLIVETEDKDLQSEQSDSSRFPCSEETSRGCVDLYAEVENADTIILVSEKDASANISSQMTVCTSDLGPSLSSIGTSSLNVNADATKTCTTLVNVGTPEKDVNHSRSHMQQSGAPKVRDSSTSLSDTVTNSECVSLLGPSNSSTVNKSSVLSGNVLQFLAKPMLSRDSFIDLDEDFEDTHKLETGISGLMDRMIKHSRTASVRKSRNIEITTVSKETVDTGRQELKLEKLVYSVDDGVDETSDPLLKRPGARLTLLREKLRASMKVKREESMQKRYEMFEQEYGGSYKEQRMEEDAKEEAELTDQTDTDEEEEEEEEEEIDEEMEEDEEEKAVKRNSNPFVNEEADDEDEDEDYDSGEEGNEEAAADDDDDDSDKADDEDEESVKDAEQCNTDDSLSLNLDTEDVVDEESTTDEKTKVSSFGRHSLKKMKTMDLFDEDANTEAEGVFQKSNADEAEFEKRAFEEVSLTCLSKTKSSEKDISGYPADIQLLDPMEADQKEELTISNMSQLRDNSMTSIDSSFDMLGSLISAGQRPALQLANTQMLQIRATPELYDPSSIATASGDQLVENLVTLSTPVVGKGISSADEDIFLDDNLHLCLDEESQLHHTDKKWRHEGKSYLGVVGTQLQRHLVMGDGSNLPLEGSVHAASSQEGISQGNNMDELLGLCSGNFSSLAASSEASSVFNPISTMTQSDANMDQLLGLCSGQFTSLSSSCHTDGIDTKTLSSSHVERNLAANDDILKDGASSDGFTFDNSPIKKKPTKKRKVAISDDEDDELEDKNNDSFDIVSMGDNDQQMSDVEIFSDADEDRESEKADMEKPERFKGFVVKGKHGKIRKEFVEDEAELSGSECGSDEDLELDEKDDFLEQEAGDQDDIGTEEELRDQVHRVHLKTMIDQDAREIRLLQEQYLPDGDLQSDGTGRMRRFRWKNADDDTQNDLGRNSEDEQAEEEGENEARWRTERLEREKFLEQHKEMDTANQASRLLKLGRAIFHKKSETSTPSPVSLTPRTPLSGENPLGLFKVPGQGHGSFLSRSKTALAKLAETTKVSSNAKQPRNSRNFVFSTISSPEHKEKMAVQANHATPASARPPPKKRPCPERRNSLPPNSIFMLFDKAS